MSKEPNAEARFKEMQEAYEVLKDPPKRAAYDELGSDWKSGQQFRPPPDFGQRIRIRGGTRRAPAAAAARARARPGRPHAQEGFSDFFSSLFGGGRPFAAGGAVPGARRATITRASTSPWSEAFQRHHAHARDETSAGQGATARWSCSTHTVRVTIPAGVTEGQLIRLAGQGEPGAGGGRVPAISTSRRTSCRTRVYALDGRDVTLTFPVAPWEAALGASVTVPTLGGEVAMQIPAGAQSGQKLRLRGRGLPGQPAGDQYVQLKVVLPPASSPQARALYEEMRAKLAFDPRASETR